MLHVNWIFSQVIGFFHIQINVSACETYISHISTLDYRWIDYVLVVIGFLHMWFRERCFITKATVLHNICAFVLRVQ